jgi:guanylate kinase
MQSRKRGNLIVISGPSGVGKSTVVRQLLQSCDLPLELSVSATTRRPRPGEVNGVDYRFMDGNEFARLRANDEFIECVEVFGAGEWYGTLRQPVFEALDRGHNIILEIDVNGALQVIRDFPSAITIFIHPGSMEILERRLRGRETESESQIRKRLAVASSELEMARHYDHVLTNEDIQATAGKICGLLKRLQEDKPCTTS